MLLLCSRANSNRKHMVNKITKARSSSLLKLMSYPMAPVMEWLSARVLLLLLLWWFPPDPL